MIYRNSLLKNIQSHYEMNVILKNIKLQREARALTDEHE